MSLSEKCHVSRAPYIAILNLGAWGFVIVMASFLFFYVGFWLDRLFGTSPAFMVGLFLLAAFIAIWRLYQDASQRRNHF